MRLTRNGFNLEKVLFIRFEKFRTHNVRFRNSLYFFILETPVMPPLNTLGQNGLKSVFYATLEMPDFEL
jgi:hypothetical protein